MVVVTKTPRKRTSQAERAFSIAVEGLRGDFRVFGEALSSFGLALSTLDQNFHAFRVEVGERFDRVEGHIDRVEGDIGLLKDAVVENTHEIRKLHVAVERKVDRDEVVAVVEQVLVSRGR
jgi:hypothetical protein